MGFNPLSPERARLMEAVLPHVPFDGWSESALRAGASDIGLSESDVRTLCPRGPVDLAVAAHQAGDAEMARRLEQADLADMRFRDRVAEAVWLRLASAGDREIVRRAAALFALPHLAPEGAKLMWGTADAIWEALGDGSRDANWYSKRVTLSAVYSACVLYWLGDESPDATATRAFIDRRIEDVMTFEKVKGQLRGSEVLKPFLRPFEAMMSGVKAPSTSRRDPDVPGYWAPKPGASE
jgi:ubiquinone biosynthesis protein COQ9